ncbi:MAG TPA: hypothetical protein VEA99_13550 [Gemmatimonadaceae bacterium]|nr:hypothetical protein [Gemmatimonadaceae bacterium]
MRLTAARAHRDALRESVVEWTRALRQTGTPLPRVLSLMRSAVTQGMADRTTDAPATDAGLEEAVGWAAEAYRVA